MYIYFKYLAAQSLKPFQKEEERRGVVSKLSISLLYSGLILKRSHNVAGSKLKPHLLSHKMGLKSPFTPGREVLEANLSMRKAIYPEHLMLGLI